MMGGSQGDRGHAETGMAEGIRWAQDHGSPGPGQAEVSPGGSRQRGETGERYKDTQVRGALGSTVVRGSAVQSVRSPGKTPGLLSDAVDIESLGCKSTGSAPGARAGSPFYRVRARRSCREPRSWGNGGRGVAEKERTGTGGSSEMICVKPSTWCPALSKCSLSGDSGGGG